MEHGEGRAVIVLTHRTVERSGGADRFTDEVADTTEHAEGATVALEARVLAGIEQHRLRAADGVRIGDDGGVQIMHAVHAGPGIHGARVGRRAAGQLHQGFVGHIDLVGDIVHSIHRESPLG